MDFETKKQQIVFTKRSDFEKKKIKIIYIEKNSRQENYNVLLQRLFKILTNDTYNIQAIENSY